MSEGNMRKMKDSGVEWIGEIPEGWATLSFKKILVRNDGGIWGDEPTGHGDVLVIRSTEQTIDGEWIFENPAYRDLSGVQNLSNYVLKTNDLLITKSSGSNNHIGKTTIVNSYVESLRCCFSNFIQRLRVSDSTVARYYWYILNSSIARNQLVYLQNSTSGLGNITAENIDNIIVPLPPYKKQLDIIQYLDEKCAKLDAVIEKQRASIEELKAYKLAVITEAVTKGLNPDVEMKDSGIEWVSKVPVDIIISRVGLHYDIILGKMLCPEQPNDAYTLEKYYCAADVHFDGISVTTERKKMWFNTDEKKLYLVNNGDLLVVEGGTGAGGCAIVEKQIEPTYVQNSIMIVRNKRQCDVKYLRYWIECLVNMGYIDVVCNKATLPHFTKDKLSKVPLLLFPLPEQQAISDYLDKKCSEINTIIDHKQQLIEKLTAYKKSLIYEVVTGKKEV